MTARWLEDPTLAIQHYLIRYHEDSGLWSTLCRRHIPSTDEDVVVAHPSNACRVCAGALHTDRAVREGIEAARAALTAALPPKGLRP